MKTIDEKWSEFKKAVTTPPKRLVDLYEKARKMIEDLSKPKEKKGASESFM